MKSDIHGPVRMNCGNFSGLIQQIRFSRSFNISMQITTSATKLDHVFVPCKPVETVATAIKVL